MTDDADDPYYLHVLRHPETDDLDAVVAKRDRYVLKENWQQRCFALDEIYRLRDEAWEQHRAAYGAWRECDPAINQGIDYERLGKSVPRLEAYAQKLDRIILEQEELGRIKKSTP